LDGGTRTVVFNFFRKDPARDESVQRCGLLAREAKIDVALEAGRYAGFLIRIDEDGTSLAPHFKHPEARTAFVDGIESRIRNGNFKDPGADIQIVAEGRGLTGWTAETNILRAVIGRGETPLFTWEPG
jgi:hypothetical protein